MGRVFLVDLGSKTQYRCRFCESPLALKDDVLSWVIPLSFPLISSILVVGNR
ncbi:hypothetical protein SLEP1_g13594 [Rubroshorea leprosula]|uniref:Yippee domain-containing protein n=1 Tax=Rubroshorea leprosula TaxID=152421 RepID=A0AAV5IGF2_9ROSI|nr:hypothetical protein SLEP1_g13594 [Rubroshorea leprosula]